MSVLTGPGLTALTLRLGEVSVWSIQKEVVVQENLRNAVSLTKLLRPVLGQELESLQADVSWSASHKSSTSFITEVRTALDAPYTVPKRD